MGKKSEEASEKIVRNIPTSENGAGVLCTTKSGQKYQISQNVEKSKFTLWKVVEKGFFCSNFLGVIDNLYAGVSELVDDADLKSAGLWS